MGGTIYIAFGVVRTHSGEWGAIFSPGGGGTTAVVGAAVGVSGVWSNARRVGDYQGAFAETGVGGGGGIGVAGTAALGRADDGTAIKVMTLGLTSGVKCAAPLRSVHFVCGCLQF